MAGVNLNERHNERWTRLYRVWDGMKQRCTNKNRNGYENYGGKGVVICDDWLDYKNFSLWAKANGYKNHLTLERKDSNEGYNPDNCVWATYAAQARNKSTNVSLIIFGETKLQRDWALDPRCVVHRATFEIRIKRGWEAEKALTTPSTIPRKAVKGNASAYAR